MRVPCNTGGSFRRLCDSNLNYRELWVIWPMKYAPHTNQEMSVDVCCSAQYKSYLNWKFLSRTTCQAQTSETEQVTAHGS